VHNERSKQDRILGLEPRYANGDILHNREVPFIKDLEEELKRFPRSRHDDISDALANLLEIAYPSRNRQRRDEWDSGPVTVRRSGNYPA
jgi:predicted phage terminase large subunit-like protein